MKEILVIRLSAIGDILLTTPLLQHLKTRYPEARITFLVKERYADFIRACPDADAVSIWKPGVSVLAMRQILQADTARYDLVLDLQSNLKSRVLSLLLRAETKRRYKKPYLNRLLLVYLKVNRYAEKKKISDRYFETLTEIDDTPRTETIHLSREKLPKKIERFARARPVLIAPGARWATKRWPEEYFASLASKILEKHPQQNLIWLGGHDEAGVFEFMKEHPYLRRHEKRMLFLCGELSVGQMTTLADQSRAIITNDSGLMHLLSAASTPLIALFLSTVEEFGFYPLSAGAEVLAARDIPCRPCNHKGLAGCPKKHFRCARELSADQVYGTLVKYLTWQSVEKLPKKLRASEAET